MNLKKLTKAKYLLRTMFIAAIGGVIIGLIVSFYAKGTVNTVLFTTMAAGMLGVAISSMNYKNLLCL